MSVVSPQTTVSAPPLEESFRFWRRLVSLNLLLVFAVVAAYWAAWFLDRGLVAVESSTSYVDFEQAFPLGDAWLFLLAALGLFALWRGRPRALLWLLVLGGGGIYLCALDVLYDLEHGIYSKGGSGVVELAINLYTLASSAGTIYFAWHYRRELDPAPPAA